MLLLTDGRLIAYGTRKNEYDFRLYFKDEDSEHQIRVKDLIVIFDKEDFCVDDYSLKINEL